MLSYDLQNLHDASIAKLVDSPFTMRLEILPDGCFKVCQESNLNEVESKSANATASNNVEVKLSKAKNAPKVEYLHQNMKSSYSR